MHLPADHTHARGIANCIVQAERHRAGLWGDITPRQDRRIERVIRADARGRLTKQDVMRRLWDIARSTR
jgi:hypothetical protein